MCLQRTSVSIWGYLANVCILEICLLAQHDWSMNTSKYLANT